MSDKTSFECLAEIHEQYHKLFIESAKNKEFNFPFFDEMLNTSLKLAHLIQDKNNTNELEQFEKSLNRTLKWVKEFQS